MLLYEKDIASDLSVFHRIDDIDTQLTSVRYFELAYRLAAYGGAVAGRYRITSRGATPASSAASTASAGVPIDPTPEQIEQMRNAARVRTFGQKAAAGGIHYVSLAEITKMSAPL